MTTSPKSESTRPGAGLGKADEDFPGKISKPRFYQ
jgi:hypothetical protein